MNYQDYQQEKSVLWDIEELERTFRGKKSAVMDAAKRFTLEHFRIQKALSKSTAYQILDGKESWEPAVDAFVDLQGYVHDNPREFCEPPVIPEDWKEFRSVALDYAPNVWWFDALKLEEVGVAASSWQSQLSRDTTPRKWPEIRERAQAWREGVLNGLDAWEYRASLQRHHREHLAQTWVKDALDRWGYEIALDVLKFAKQAPFWDLHSFDPADPKRAMYGWNDSALLPHERTDYDAILSDWIEAGFPEYVEDEPQEGWTETKVELWEWTTEDVRNSYQVLTEFNFEHRWSSVDREMVADRKPVRKQVWYTPSRAEEDEKILTHRIVKDVPNKTAQSGVERKVETFEYVLRWRKVDMFDTTLNQGRETALKMVGADYENLSIDSFLKQSHPPIEEPDPSAGRLPGDYTRA